MKQEHFAPEAVPDARLCPQAARVIGFYEGDTAEYRWAGARIETLGRRRWIGDLLEVDMRVSNRYARLASATGTSPLPTSGQRDRVYLVEVRGLWKIAKLSAVADSATIGAMDPGDPLSPPDVEAERSWYRRRLASFRLALRRDRATAAHAYTDCSVIGAVQRIPDVTGDLQPRADLPSVDLTRVSFAGTADRICFDFETAGAITPPIAMIVQVRGPGRAAAGFALDAVLTKPGQALLEVRYPGSDQNALAGSVGVDGRRMSVVMRRDAFPSQIRGTLENFSWTAASVYSPPGYRGTSQVTDSVPEYDRPPGRFP